MLPGNDQGEWQDQNTVYQPNSGDHMHYATILGLGSDDEFAMPESAGDGLDVPESHKLHSMVLDHPSSSSIPPQTVDPRCRSSTPPGQPPVKRSRNSPKKGPGRSRAAPTYRRGSDLQLPKASTSGSNKGKGKARVDDDFTATIDQMPQRFQQQVSQWKTKHKDDGWYDIMRIIERRIHHLVMEAFFPVLSDDLYHALLKQGVKAYRDQNKDAKDPMNGPYIVLSFCWWLLPTHMV